MSAIYNRIYVIVIHGMTLDVIDLSRRRHAYDYDVALTRYNTLRGINNKKLCCRREAARCSMSLKLLLGLGFMLTENGNRPRTISFSRFTVTMALSCIISEIKRDVGRKS